MSSVVDKHPLPLYIFVNFISEFLKRKPQSELFYHDGYGYGSSHAKPTTTKRTTTPRRTTTRYVHRKTRCRTGKCPLAIFGYFFTIQFRSAVSFEKYYVLLKYLKLKMVQTFSLHRIQSELFMINIR